jgi:hypothetical protein
MIDMGRLISIRLSYAPHRYGRRDSAHGDQGYCLSPRQDHSEIGDHVALGMRRLPTHAAQQMMSAQGIAMR